MGESTPEDLGTEVAFETAIVDAEGALVARPTVRARTIVEDLGGGAALEMVVVPGGRFPMGSPDGEGYDDERPRHEVSVAPFLIGRYPVTQAQWRALMGPPPSRFSGDRLPVDGVSWRLAQEFCRRLSAATGRAYRLPSEAEWEYACRAGSTTPFGFGDTLTTDLANYNGLFAYGRGPSGLYRHTTTAVGALPPNAFGVCDTHGNLWEWCADAWHDTYGGAPTDGTPWESNSKSPWGVLRGGSWHDEPASCRSAVRLRYRRSEGDELVGFRVAASLADGGVETAATGPVGNQSGLDLDAVSSTLVAPLYYRAVESRRLGGMLKDRRAVELIDRLGYDFGWLDDRSLTQVLTAMRVRELDNIARRFLAERPNGIVVDLGCGLDFRFDRIDDGTCDWYGVDVPKVIALRRRLAPDEPARSHLIACSALDPAWCDQIDRADRPILFVAEGLVVYLLEAEARRLVLTLRSRFPGAELAFDALPRAQILLFSLHPVLRKTGARLGWTPGEDDELEGWAPGIRLLSRWSYFDEPERRLGPARLIRYIPHLGSGSRILRYRLG